MDAVERFAVVFTETAMKATVDLGRARGIDFARVDLDVLVAVLRVEVKAALERFLDDGRVLAGAGRSAWLDTLMRAECSAAAARTLATIAA